MKIAGGVGLVILFLVVFAGASMTKTFDSYTEDTKIVPLNSSGQMDILFAGDIALKNISVPVFANHSLQPISENWQAATLVPIANYLKAHNEKVIQITGNYLSTEQQVIGGYTSIGAARAGLLAQKLMEMGISAPRILVSDQLLNNSALTSPLKFEFLNDNIHIP